jgi:hypothetical protein
MHGDRRFWLPVVFLGCAAALLLMSQPVAGASQATMAVDAVPGGGVDSGRTVTGTAPFDVNIVMTAASAPYQGYQYKLDWDPAVLALDSQTDLEPEGLDLCANTPERPAFGGCARASGTVTFTGALSKLSFHCLSTGTSPLHLMTKAQDPQFPSSALGLGGAEIETTLVDAQISCGVDGEPPPLSGGSTPGSEEPAGSPRPVPEGMEAVPLVGGCQFSVWTGADATGPAELTELVGPARNLNALWAMQPPPVWKGYSPDFPEVSDMEAVDLLDVLAICMLAPGDFVRPIV